MSSQTEAIAGEIASIHLSRDTKLDALIALAEEQRAILVDGRHAELPENVTKFDPLMLDLANLDKRELALVQQAEEADGTGLALPEIAPGTGEKASRLRELTETNRELLAHAMEFVNFSMGIICKVAAESSGGGAAAGPDQNPAVLLDAKV